MAHIGVKADGAQNSTAIKFLEEQQIEVDLASPAAKRVLRKIDMPIMPLVLGLYTLQLLVRTDLPTRSGLT